MLLIDHVRRHARRYSLSASLVVPLVVAAGFVPVRTTFSNVGAALTLVAVIEVMAIIGRRAEGIIATVSAALWFDFFLTTPYDRFTISRRLDLEATICLVVVGLIVTELAVRSRSHRRAASTGANYVTQLAHVAARASGAHRIDELVSSVSQELTGILSLRSCHYETVLSGPPYAQIQADGSVVHVGMLWPADDLGIPGPRAEIPCEWRGALLGRFVLSPTPGRPITREQRVVAVALVNVVAASMHDLSADGSPEHPSKKG